MHDELSYREVEQQDWYYNRLNDSPEKLSSIYSRFISSEGACFLRSFGHFFSPAKFHIVPRIHKNPVVGRPIASYSYITSFIDELTKPKIRMPTVLRDLGELV